MPLCQNTVTMVRTMGSPLTLRAIWVVLLLVCGWTHAATRVALVGDAASPTTAAVLDLATVQLSTGSGLELLDRQEIDRVLKEHKLSASGLADPDKALAAGQLLAADLLAVIENDAGQALDPTAGTPGKSRTAGPPVGLVVYNPKSGLRLWDEALAAATAESAAAAIAAAVQAAAAKSAAATRDGRCLALLSVRNADLPRDMDSVCEALAALLERQLLQFPNTVVLERRRLQYANDERSLVPATLDGALRAALLALDVEVSRAEPRGTLRAVVLLSDASGRKVGSCSASGQGQDLPGLVRALADELARTLKTTAGPEDRPREARRYASEAVWCMAHRYRIRAVAAAEAAFALEPSLAHSKLLTRQLLFAALALIFPGTNGPPPRREDVLRCLGRTQRAVDLRTEMMQTAVREKPELVYLYRSSEDPTFNDQLATIVARINQLTLGDPALGQTEAGSVRDAALMYLRDGIDLMRASVSLPKGRFDGYTVQTWGDLEDIARVCASTEECVRLLTPVLSAWLDLAATLPPERLVGTDAAGIGFNRMLNLLLDPEDLNRRDPRPAYRWNRQVHDAAVRDLLPVMRRHPHPTVRLYADLVDLVTVRLGDDWSLVDEDTPFAKGLVRALRAALEAAGPGPGQLTRTQAYYAVVAAVEAKEKHVPGLAPEAFLGIWRLMLERGEIEQLVVYRVLGVLYSGTVPPDAATLIDQTLKLCAQRDRHVGPVFSPIRMTTDLLTARASLPSAATPGSDTGVSTWCQVTPVLDAIHLGANTTIRQCLLANGYIYGIALKASESLRPFRLALGSGRMEWLGPAEKLVVSVPETPLFAVGSRPPCVTGACLGPEHVFVGTLEQGVFAFPLRGGAVTRIDTTFGLPSNFVRALAWLEGKLYLSLGDDAGYLVAVALGTRQVEVLASSQRKEKRSPLDGTSRFTITHLVADPARHQLLVGVLTGPCQGLWCLDAASGAMQRLFTGRGPDWGSQVRDHTILFENSRATVRYDLAAKAPRLIRAGTRFRELPDYDVTTAPIKDEDMAPGPQAVIDDWLWIARPLSRIGLKTGVIQAVPPLRRGQRSALLNPATLIEPLDGGKRVLVGDWYGLWLLTPTEETGP